MRAVLGAVVLAALALVGASPAYGQFTDLRRDNAWTVTTVNRLVDIGTDSRTRTALASPVDTPDFLQVSADGRFAYQESVLRSYSLMASSSIQGDSAASFRADFTIPDWTKIAWKV